ITSFSAVAMPNKMVCLSGTLTDTNPATTWVNFSGQAQGTVEADSTGHFSKTVSAYGLGRVMATARDQIGLSSSAVTANITDSAPVISDLTATPGNYGVWTITGKVTDQMNPAGLVVVFSGLTAVQGKTATVQADGTFSLSVVIPSNQSGYIYAQTTD